MNFSNLTTTLARRRNVFVSAAVITGAIALSSCQSSEKIQLTQFGDNKLACASIKQQNQQLDEAHKKVEQNKAFNFGWLFWWPGMVYTYYDADEAEKSIRNRRDYLTSAYNANNCS